MTVEEALERGYAIHELGCLKIDFSRPEKWWFQGRELLENGEYSEWIPVPHWAVDEFIPDGWLPIEGDLVLVDWENRIWATASLEDHVPH